MSDFTDSLREDTDDELKNFVLEMFDKVEKLHSESTTEIEQSYHQGEKDALRRVLAIMTGRWNIIDIIPSSVIAHKLRGDISLDTGRNIQELKND